MTDEILRNGVPHNVTTSLVTRNAVLPQNIFIKEESSTLRDSIEEGVAPALVKRDPSPKFDQTSSTPEPQAAPNYPVAKDKLAANDALSITKSHIRDNIQALKNLAHSDNFQRMDEDEFTKNMQSLGATRLIEDNKLYLEKKSIKSNRQLIAKSTTARAAPNLATPNATTSSDLDSEGRLNQARRSQTAESSRKDKDGSDADNEFQMRVKKLKRHVRNVDSTLQNLDPDK